MIFIPKSIHSIFLSLSTMLNRIKKKLANNDFLKSLAVLMTGTLIAQIIGYLLAPIITRLYTPAEMGEFGIFQRVTVLLATIATVRYEYALPLPKKDNHAFVLFRFALKISLITISLCLVAGIAFALMRGKGVDFYLILLLLIISVFSLAFFNLGTNWSIRKKYFKKISLSKMSNSITLNSSRVVFGFLGWGSFGLILSFVLSLIVGASFFIYDFITLKFISKSALNKLKTRILSREYKNFPLASLPHSLSDHARDLFIGIILIELFSESVFGSFDHTYKMLRIPAMLIGASLSQVFFNHISGKFNDGTSIMPMFKKIIGYLVLFSLIPFSVVYFFGTELFTFVFGNQWVISGKLSEIMAPWLLLNFIVTPLSTIPLVFNKQKSFFLISLLTSVLQVGGFLILPYLLIKNDAQLFMVFELITWSQVLMNILILYYLYHIVKHQKLKS